MTHKCGSPGFAGQRFAPLAPRDQLTRQGGQHRIPAQLIMVVKVFVTERDAHHPL